jgi:hypothetical protein
MDVDGRISSNWNVGRCGPLEGAIGHSEVKSRVRLGDFLSERPLASEEQFRSIELVNWFVRLFVSYSLDIN